MLENRNHLFNRAILALVFTVCFAIYLAPELSIPLQLAPIVLFAVLVFGRAFASGAFIPALVGFLDVDGLVYVLFLSILMVECSMSSAYEDALNFALLLSACLILGRIYMSVVTIKEVLDAFYWSAIASLTIFVPLGFGALVQSATNLQRLMAFNFHPNGLAMQLSAYLCVMVWKFMTGGWATKALSLLLGLVSLFIVFLTSSRGTLVALACGGLFFIAMVFATSGKERRKKIVRLSGVAFVILLICTALIYKADSTKDTYDAMDQMLALSSHDRGLDSGMTGRVDVWHEVVRAVSDGSWLFGHGIRSSDVVWSYDPKIDNSYLVILYDMGIVPLILITWRFVRMLQRSTSNCLSTSGKDEKRLWLICGIFLVVVLVTSIVERSLFAVGNPFSLLAFLLFAAPDRSWGPDPVSPRVPGRSMQPRWAAGD
ncbi:MAG TPA: O-antigen ligase family protein [Candidatus Sulfotelmatobacter sp.]|nr:O-antigen ligase family protein [Candidatus Sulfotelmatobacter sp.]